MFSCQSGEGNGNLKGSFLFASGRFTSPALATYSSNKVQFFIYSTSLELCRKYQSNPSFIIPLASYTLKYWWSFNQNHNFRNSFVGLEVSDSSVSLDLANPPLSDSLVAVPCSPSGSAGCHCQRGNGASD